MEVGLADFVQPLICTCVKSDEENVAVRYVRCPGCIPRRIWSLPGLLPVVGLGPGYVTIVIVLFSADWKLL